MRDDEVARGRDCICPEVNRNKNIGEVRRLWLGWSGGARRGFAEARERTRRAGPGLARWGRPQQLPSSPAPQVGANMNKQAFKRYLKTMGWNENQTVRAGVCMPMHPHHRLMCRADIRHMPTP